MFVLHPAVGGNGDLEFVQLTRAVEELPVFIGLDGIIPRELVQSCRDARGRRY